MRRIVIFSKKMVKFILVMTMTIIYEYINSRHLNRPLKEKKIIEVDIVI